jgi:hypothetical protein
MYIRLIYIKNNSLTQMKLIKIIIVLLAGVGIYSCYKQKEKSPNTSILTHKEAVDSLHVKNSDSTEIIYRRLSAKESKAVFDAYDISQLMVQDTAIDYYYNRVDGFFGKDNYRIQFYFTNAKRDSLNSNKYWIEGKSNFKETIRSFKGSIVFDSISVFKDPSLMAEIQYDEYLKHRALYEAKGKFKFLEDSTEKSTGKFEGDIYIDFATKDKGETILWYYTTKTKSLGAGYKADGYWTSYASGKSKPLVFAKDLFIFANSILKDFSFGERSVEINEKYRNLGWQDFWEPNEWWIEKKKEIQ